MDNKFSVFFYKPKESEKTSGGNLYNKILQNYLEESPHFRSQKIEFNNNNIQDSLIDRDSFFLVDELLYSTSLIEKIKRLKAFHIALVHVPSFFLKKKSEDEIISELKYLRSCDGLIFTSQQTKEDTYFYFKKYSFDLPSSVVIYPGRPKTEMMNKNNRIRSLIKILIFSSISKNKNQLGAIKFFEKLLKFQSRFNFQLIMRGGIRDINYYLEIIAYIKQAHLEDKIKLLPEVDHKQISTVYQDCSLVLIPSFYESFSMVAQEALSFGRPVVSWAKGGICDYFDNDVGLKLQDPDVEIFYTWLFNLLDKPVKWKELNENCRKRIRQMKTWSENFNELENFFSQIRIKRKVFL